MILKKLVPSKAIGAQPHFVETFNALVDFVLNLKGDKDVNDSTGIIEVDRSDIEHPVIRADRLAIGGGEASTSWPQPFEPTFAADATTGESHISAIGPGYAPWGRRLLQVGSPASSSSVWTTARGRLGLKITHPTTYGGTPTVEIVVAASSSSGTTASLPDSTDTISYLPLYDFDGGRITLDLRCYLALGVFE